MLGLLIKDYYNLKGQLKFYLFFIVLYGGISAFSQSSTFLSGIICVFCTILPTTALAYDERTQWDKFALSAPVSRREIVISKYLLGITFVILGFILIFISGIFLKMDLIYNLGYSLVFSSLSLCYLSLSLPILYQFGTEKSRILMAVIFLIPILFLLILDKSGVHIENFNTFYLVLFGGIGVILLFIISIALSLKIYCKKEF